MMCSISLQVMTVRERGLYLKARFFLPFLKIGITAAVSQS